MEANADGERRHKLGTEDGDWQDLTMENSSESFQPDTIDHNSAGHRGLSFGLEPTTAPDFMTQDSHDGPPQAVTRNNNLKVNATSEANGHEFEEGDLEDAADVLPPPQSGGGGGNENNAVKTGRQLTFADETGGTLVEMSYSHRTHYSKQAGPGAVQGVPKGGCCVIQ